jgi:uncharacterized protein with HEPN domain
MRRDARTYLWDIQAAADAIDRFVAGLDLQVYAATEIVHTAVERKFEIIGEALGQLAKLDPALASRIPNLREIVAFRNLLIHGYGTIEHGRVWRTIEKSLPGLRASVSALLDELGPVCYDA